MRVTPSSFSRQGQGAKRAFTAWSSHLPELLNQGFMHQELNVLGQEVRLVCTGELLLVLRLPRIDPLQNAQSSASTHTHTKGTTLSHHGDTPMPPHTGLTVVPPLTESPSG